MSHEAIDCKIGKTVISTIEYTNYSPPTFSNRSDDFLTFQQIQTSAVFP